MKVHFQKIVAMFLVCAFSFGLITAIVPSASAAESSDVLSDAVSVASWNKRISNVLSINPISDFVIDDCWDILDTCMSAAGWGAVDSKAALDSAANRFNMRMRSSVVDPFRLIAGSSFPILLTNAVSAFDESRGVWRLKDENTGLWLVNKVGYYPYYCETAIALPDGNPDNIQESTRSDRWVEYLSVTGPSKVVVLSADTLSSLCATLNASDRYCRVALCFIDYEYMYAIVDEDAQYIYCNYEGYPYISRSSSSPGNSNTTTNNSAAINNSTTDNSVTDVLFNYIVNENGDTVDNSQVININDGIFNFVDESGKTENFIENLVYDMSTKTYSADTYYVTYDTTNNNYTITNNTYNVQYHINYTSVTYIGQTAEYDRQYEFYYELPDGRSSADLTAADLEQLSLVFADVVNYARSADDVNMRVLYHFDGDTSDSSYWGYCTSFDWDYGASLTYMDEGTFNGSLYLDENIHDFTITLPNNDAAGDFTLQFRYYQSYTAAPVKDSYIEIGDMRVWYFDGKYFYSGLDDDSVFAFTSVGSWNELCLMRSDGVLYFYINGVCYETVSNGNYLGNTVRFYFGGSQQTYKKLDELRFTKGAIYEAGQDYEPTVVPYDTNLSLVLPDSELPVADEYFVLTPGEDNLLDDLGLSDWTNSNVISNLITTASRSYPVTKQNIAYNSAYTSFSVNDGYIEVLFNGTAIQAFSDNGSIYLRNALFLPSYLSMDDGDSMYSYGYLYDNKSYCLSVLLKDGTVSYCVFNGRSLGSGTYTSMNSSLVQITGGCIANYSGGTGYYSFGFFVSSFDGSPLDIVYMELVEGTEPSFSLEWQSAVYSSGQLENSPVLAVRSNMDVTTYQIGGVRPSYPTKGQVWALVEGSRITSLQQYTGYAWVSVDGRIWTGSRWIPYSSFDVYTLQDYWDVIGSSGDYTYIYTESGFWDWWQRAWIDFRSWLSGVFGSGSGSGGDISDKVPGSSGGSGGEDGSDDESGGIGFFDLASSLIGSVWKIVSGAVTTAFGGIADLISSVGNVSGFFSFYTDGEIFDVINYEGEDIWD